MGTKSWAYQRTRLSVSSVWPWKIKLPRFSTPLNQILFHMQWLRLWNYSVIGVGHRCVKDLGYSSVKRLSGVDFHISKAFGVTGCISELCCCKTPPFQCGYLNSRWFVNKCQHYMQFSCKTCSCLHVCISNTYAYILVGILKFEFVSSVFNENWGSSESTLPELPTMFQSCLLVYSVLALWACEPCGRTGPAT